MFLSVNKEFHSIFQAFQIGENVEKHKRMADVTATIYFKKKNKKTEFSKNYQIWRFILWEILLKLA